MSEKDILKWLAGMFIVFALMAFWLSGKGANNPECDNSQYSAQSC